MKKKLNEINEKISDAIDKSSFVNTLNYTQYAIIAINIRVEKEQTQYGLMYVARFNGEMLGDMNPLYARSPARAIAFMMDAISEKLRSGSRG